MAILCASFLAAILPREVFSQTGTDGGGGTVSLGPNGEIIGSYSGVINGIPIQVGPTGLVINGVPITPGSPLPSIPGVPNLSDFISNLPAIPGVGNISSVLGGTAGLGGILGGGTVPGIGNVSIGSLPALGNLPISSIPGLSNLPISSIPGLSNLPGLDNLSPNTLIGNIPGFNNLSLSSIPGFSNLPISSIPGLSNLSLSNIPGFSNIPGLSNLSLSRLPGLSNLSLSNIPGLSNLPIGNIPGLGNLSLGSLPGLGNLSLGNIPGLSNLSLGNIPGLGNLPISSIPGLSNLPGLGSLSPNTLISNIPGLSNLSLSSIPGLSNLSLSSIPGLSNLSLSSIPGLGSLSLSSIPGLGSLSLGGVLGLGGLGGLFGGQGSPDVTPPLPICKPFPPPFVCVSCAAIVAAKEFEEWTWTAAPLGPVWGTWPRVREHMTSERTAQQVWWISIFWEDNILPALMLMAEQMSAVAMHQMFMVGAMLDAKHQLETQQLLQRLNAKAHKDYHPSIGVCEFGSSIKSLAATERRVEVTAVIMSQRAQDRNLGNMNSAASIGDDSDKENRIRQFRQKFCDPMDNNNGLDYLCEHDQSRTLGGAIGATDKKRMNKDIDYTRTIDFPWTLEVDMLSMTPGVNGLPKAATVTDTEEDVYALASNLYGHEIFTRPPPKTLETKPGVKITAMQKHYMDMRSLVAKRSVAENSFNAIAAMKSEGTPGSRDYLVALFKSLGVPNLDINEILGTNPSYYAQMEILTKKIYQNPDFYTNLYDTPVNVARKGVAIQSIGLMQKFDLFKSYLRTEASLSVLLELAIMDLQEEVENELNQISGEGERGL
ncbi:MAG: leucine-rich repeat domain-containing protein [Alphaproteobacteria bacterium]|nr:leucine-rich repeat domain-containing protein [Alphaproteobacteria bacterium]